MDQQSTSRRPAAFGPVRRSPESPELQLDQAPPVSVPTIKEKLTLLPDLRDPVDAKDAIVRTCIGLAEFLSTKNAAYGNSVFDPVRVLSDVSAETAIRVRIDDKLSRLMRGTKGAQAAVPEDTILDLAGYFVLLLAARGWRMPADATDAVLSFLAKESRRAAATDYVETTR